MADCQRKGIISILVKSKAIRSNELICVRACAEAQLTRYRWKCHEVLAVASRGEKHHMVLRRGVAHEHGAQELLLELQKLGYHIVMLKCEGGPALKSV